MHIRPRVMLLGFGNFESQINIGRRNAKFMSRMSKELDCKTWE